MPPTRSTRPKGKRSNPGVNIEELGQQKARYFIIHAEESHILAADPTARDAAIAKLYKNPEVKTGFPCASTFIGPNDDPEAFLKAVETVFDNPERSVDQRVFRLHAAVSGLMVFNEHRLDKILPNRNDLQLKVDGRAHQILREWMEKNLPQLPHARSKIVHASL